MAKSLPPRNRILLSEREIAALLPALRSWESSCGFGEHLETLAGHFEDDTPLSSVEIDELCERLNLIGPSS